MLYYLIDGVKLIGRTSLSETIERGTLLDNELIDGLLQSISTNQIDFIKEGYEHISKVFCENEGCGIIPVTIRIEKCNTQRELNFNWIVSDTVIDTKRCMASIQLTDANWGSYLKNNLSRELTLRTPPITFEQGAAKGIFFPSPNDIYGWTLDMAFSEVIDTISGGNIQFCNPNNVLSEYVITTGSNFKAPRAGNLSTYNAPLVSLECLLETVYKLFNYSWYIEDNCFYISDFNSIAKSSNLIHKIKCSDLTITNCQNEYATVKVGAEHTKFDKYYDKDQDTESGNVSYLSMVNTPSSHAPFVWDVNSPCASERQLDLTSDCINWDSNTMEYLIYDKPIDPLDPNYSDEYDDDIFIVELDSSGEMATKDTDSPFGNPRRYYNPSLTNDKILERWSCVLGGNITYDGASDLLDDSFDLTIDNSPSNDPISLTPADGGTFHNLSYDTNTIASSNYDLVNNEYIATFDHIREVCINIDFDLQGPASINRAAIDVYLVIDNGVTLQYVSFGQVDLTPFSCSNVSSCKYVYLKKGWKIYTTLFVSVNTYPAGSQTLVYCGNSTLTSHVEDYVNKIESDCKPYKFCYSGTTHIDPCKELDMIGYVEIKGRPYQIKKLERDIKTGVTNFELVSQHCNLD